MRLRINLVGRVEQHRRQTAITGNRILHVLQTCGIANLVVHASGSIQHERHIDLGLFTGSRGTGDCVALDIQAQGVGILLTSSRRIHLILRNRLLNLRGVQLDLLGHDPLTMRGLL